MNINCMLSKFVYYQKYVKNQKIKIEFVCFRRPSKLKTSNNSMSWKFENSL